MSVVCCSVTNRRRGAEGGGPRESGQGGRREEGSKWMLPLCSLPLLSPAAPLPLTAPSLPFCLHLPTSPYTCGGGQGPEWEGGGQAVAVVFLPAHVGVGEDGEARACPVLPDEDILIRRRSAALADHHIHLGSCTEREADPRLLSLREEGLRAWTPASEGRGAGGLDPWV